MGDAQGAAGLGERQKLALAADHFQKRLDVGRGERERLVCSGGRHVETCNRPAGGGQDLPVTGREFC